MGRRAKPKERAGKALGRAEAEDRHELSPEDDRARRFLDLWERNLSHLALNGPVARGSPPRR